MNAKDNFNTRLERLGRNPTNGTLCLQNVRLGDKYIILDLLAVGNRSQIYYGIQQATGLQRIFKFYNLQQLQKCRSWKEKEVCKRMSTLEAGIMTQCSSSNIVNCFDVYQDSFSKVLVVDYCNQGSLYDELKGRNFKPTDQMRAIIILKQILSAIKVLHKEYNILHKNLKSNKIMIKNGIYKLIDFGFPSVLGLEENQENCFMVPELLRNKSYDSKAEVWNVGVLFHQILYGQLPEIIKNNKENMINHLNHPNASAFTREHQGQYSKEVINFLTQSLWVQPQRRMSWWQLQNHQMFGLLNVRIQKGLSFGNDNFTTTSMSFIIPFQDELHQKYLNENSNFKDIMKRHQKEKSKIQSALYDREIEQNEKQEWNSKEKEIQFYQQRFLMQQQKANLQAILKRSYVRSDKMFMIKKLQPVTWSDYRERINRLQTIKYNQLKEYYWMCLKIQFIYEQIFKLLKQEDYLPQENREVVEFIYLILTRSFTEISWVNSKTNKNGINSKEYSLMEKCIRLENANIYEMVAFDFNKWSGLLSQQEDKISSIFKDGFNKLFKSKQSKQKQQILGGLLNIDVTVEGHTQFTMRSFRQNIEPKLKQRLSNNIFRTNCQILIDYLNILDKIWALPISLQQHHASIKECIEAQYQILQKNNAW